MFLNNLILNNRVATLFDKGKWGELRTLEVFEPPLMTLQQFLKWNLESCKGKSWIFLFLVVNNAFLKASKLI